MAQRKKHRRKRKMILQHIDEKSSMKTGFGFFQYFTIFFLNISILWKYIMKNCKLRFAFPNTLNFYNLGLRATKI